MTVQYPVGDGAIALTSISTTQSDSKLCDSFSHAHSAIQHGQTKSADRSVELTKPHGLYGTQSINRIDLV
jgi:hypothetical protein